MAHRHKRRDQIKVLCEHFDCDHPVAREFTPSEFSDWLEESEFGCCCCGHEFSVKNLQITCALCGAEIEYLNLNNLANDILCDPCPECAARWGVDEFRTVFVEGSWSEAYFIYDWTREGKDMESLERKGRTDYWEGLVHFCSAEEFIAIYRTGRITAAPTGLYVHRDPEASRAVCLTETTRPNWDELKARHGEYGFVFRKRDIIRLSGAPAIYLPQPVLDRMAEGRERIPKTLWPYLNKLAIPSVTPGVRHDFLHEREWRVPQDINFADIQPYSVTFPKRRPGIDGEELILAAAREFQELSESRSSP